MNDIERAIKFMQFSIEIQLASTRAMIHCNGRKKLGKDYLKEMGQRIVSYKIAIQALQEKAERENPKPLTLEQLKERVGKPVYVKALEDTWGIVLEDRIETEHFYYLFENFDGINKFYDYEPKERD